MNGSWGKIQSYARVFVTFHAILFFVACSSAELDEGQGDATQIEEDGFSAFNENSREVAPQLSDTYLPEEKEALGMSGQAPRKIVTKNYDVMVVRQSRSGRIYLLENKTELLPQPGKVLLLKEKGQAVMGFRVLKTYPSSREVAVKKIRTYPGHDVLESRSQYRAYEKIGDADIAAPILSDKDQQEIDELEGFDKSKEQALPTQVPETPATTESAGFENFSDTPTPVVSKKKSTQQDIRKQQDLEIVEEEEKNQKDRFPHRVTLDISMLRAPTLPVGSSYGMSAGLLYSKKVSYRIWNPKDSLAIEGGVSYYKMSGTMIDELGAETSKSFTVIPIRGTLRYDRALTEHLEFYLYGGLHYHRVASDLGATEEEIAAANTVTPAVGLGFFLQTGPQWFLRLNLGLDSIGLGIALQF